MVKVRELNEEWFSWVKTRPPIIQEMCKKYPPDRLYRLKNSGHTVELCSYCEDETMTVAVLDKWNDDLSFERQVFGISQDDLIEVEEN